MGFIRARRARLAGACLALPVLWGHAPGLRAQPEASAAVHWAYSSYFGTGRYTVDGTESVYVLSARPSWRLRDAELGEEGRALGIRLRLPIAIGAHDFDVADVGGTLAGDNVSTFSATPGVELDVPINARWSIKPLVYAGWGAEIDGDASAWIYWGGAKSVGRFHAASFDWSLVNGLTYVGYSDDASERGSLLAALIGFDFEHPLATKRINGYPVHLHWHVSHVDYFNEVEIKPRGVRDVVRIEDEWEIGAAFSTGDHRLGVRKLRWDRVGLAYRFSSDGDLTGVALTFSSLFDR